MHEEATMRDERMKRRVLLALLGLIAFALVLRAWPARLRHAWVTAVTHTNPPVAHVALTYGIGAPPLSVVLDLAGDNGAEGSATIPGDMLFVDVPLIGAPARSYTITATLTTRVLGKPRIRIARFG